MKGVFKKNNKKPESFFDSVEHSLKQTVSVFMRVLGPALAISLYCLLGLHVHAFFWIIAPLLKKRLGVVMGLAWIAIGLSLLYNIVFNHLLAMLIKPSGPKSLKKIERLRQ